MPVRIGWRTHARRPPQMRVPGRFTPDSRRVPQSPPVAAEQRPAPSGASTEDFFDMPNMKNHNIDITDNVDNWLRWGNLVMSWVKGATQTPKTVAALKAQMHTAGVDGTV